VLSTERDLNWLIVRLRPALEALSFHAFNRGCVVSHELVLKTINATLGQSRRLEIGQREWGLPKVLGRDSVPSLQEGRTGIPGDRLALAPSPTASMRTELRATIWWPSSRGRQFLN
jgi:hypothetical protein